MIGRYNFASVTVHISLYYLASIIVAYADFGEGPC